MINKQLGKHLTTTLNKLCSRLGYTEEEYKLKTKLSRLIKQGKITQEEAHNIWKNKKQ